MSDLEDMTQEVFIITCAIIIFIIVRKILIITYQGKAGKIYKHAVTDGCVVTANKINSRVIIQPDANDRRKSNRQDAVYEYFVNGKAYRKVIVYDSIELLSPAELTITLYYDKKCPKKAVTKNEAIGADRTVRIIFLTLIITIISINIIVHILGIR